MHAQPHREDPRSPARPAQRFAVVPDGPAEPLGRLVRRLRQDADLTLEGLSEASGISDRALSDIERGAARGPQHRTVLAIAAALGLTDADRTAMIRAAREGRRRATPPSRDQLPLPRDAADFTGRESELARITTAMTGVSQHRLSPLVVTGPAGYGKTTLAVRAAAALRDPFPEQLFVRLGGLEPEPPSPEAVVSGIVQALTGRASPGGSTGLLRQRLEARPPLLILDDAANESQVRAVLSVAEPAAVLVTSRRPLAGLDAVDRLFLDRLRNEDAHQLLATVVPAEQAAGADLAELVRLCDGVPLALRIAGNRLASRPGSTVASLTARMAAEDRRLDALTAGDLRMAAAIRPSFDRLRADAQELFRRLALVDGTTFGAGLAGALIGQPAGAAESLLDELTDSSLVQPVAADRYTLHALLRLYARAELEHEPPAARAAIQAAADDWLVATAARVARTLRHDTRPAPFTDAELADTSRHRELARAWLVDEADNWRAAVGRVLRRDRGGTPGVAAAASWLHGSGPMLWWPSGASPDGVRPGDAASSSSPGRRPVQLVTGARPMADLVRGHAHVVEPWAPAARTVPCRADSGR